METPITVNIGGTPIIFERMGHSYKRSYYRNKIQYVKIF